VSTGEDASEPPDAPQMMSAASSSRAGSTACCNSAAAACVRFAASSPRRQLPEDSCNRRRGSHGPVLAAGDQQPSQGTGRHGYLVAGRWISLRSHRRTPRVGDGDKERWRDARDREKERIRWERGGLGRGYGFNVVRQVSTAKMVSSYHGVHSFVFVENNNAYKPIIRKTEVM
jgi:hypothetical protein